MKHHCLIKCCIGLGVLLWLANYLLKAIGEAANHGDWERL